MDTLETSGRPSDAFAQMAENLRKQEEASPLTPMIIPPRPSTLQETTTAPDLSSTQTTTHAEAAPHISTTATDPQIAEEVEYTVDEVMEAAERAETGSRVEEDAGKDIMAEENAGDDEKIAEEDDDTGKDLDTTMAVDLTMVVDGETGSKPDVTDSEGETPVVDVEGETPGTIVSRRETPADVEGRDPVEDVSKGATPVTDVEGETPDVAEEPTSGGLQDIVDLVNAPEGDETLVDERLTRRRTRKRSILDEVDEPTGPWELNSVGRGARTGEDVPEESDCEARRLAIERKRKGKQEARILPKKPKKNPAAEPTKKLMADAIKVPFTKALESPATDSEMEEVSEQEEEPNFERAEIWIT